MKKVNKQLGMLQRAGAEKLGRAEKSVEELPDHLTIVQRHHETTRANCEKVCKRIGSSFQGSGNEYEKRLRKLPQTSLANMYHEASNDMGTTPLAQVMELCGDVTQRTAMQTAINELMIETEVLNPLSTYLESDANMLEKLFKKLQKSRLEMDSAASKIHRLEKRPIGGSSAAEHDEKRLRAEFDETESKFLSLQSQYSTELLEVTAKEHAMATNFVRMMEDQLRYHEECLSKYLQTVPKMREIIDTTPFRPAYGTDLAVHCKVNNRRTSLVIESCCAALLPHIDKEEGLFRLAGSLSQVKKLRAHMNYGLLDFTDCSPHTITGVLKLYLRELPDPLFTADRYDTWVQIASMSDHDEKLQSIYSYVHDLPTVNYDNVKYLMCFLNQMIPHKDVTKMGASNLALVIGPNLFVSGGAQDDQLQDTGPLNIIVEVIITHFDYFFPEGNEISSTVPTLYLSETMTHINGIRVQRQRSVDSGKGMIPCDRRRSRSELISFPHTMTLSNNSSAPMSAMSPDSGFKHLTAGSFGVDDSPPDGPSDLLPTTELGESHRVTSSSRVSGEGYGRTAQEKASNSSNAGRGRVLSSADKAASAASAAVLNIRSKLTPSRGDKADKPEKIKPRAPPPPSAPPLSPPSSSNHPDSAPRSRPIVPPADRDHPSRSMSPSGSSVSPTGRATSPPPNGPSPPPRPPPATRTASGSSVTSPPLTASRPPPAVPPVARKPAIANRSRTTAA